jgi:hypothetical protein
MLNPQVTCRRCNHAAPDVKLVGCGCLLHAVRKTDTVFLYGYPPLSGRYPRNLDQHLFPRQGTEFRAHLGIVVHRDWSMDTPS